MRGSRLAGKVRAIILFVLAALFLTANGQTVLAKTAVQKYTVKLTAGTKKIQKTILTGEKLQLTVKNGNKKLAVNKVSFSSSKKNVVSVSKKGILTAKKAGKAVITVKYKKKKAKIAVTVLTVPSVGTTGTEVQRLTAERLESIGWDLYGAFKWAGSISHETNIGNVDNVEDLATYGFINERGDASVRAAVFYEMAGMMGYQVRFIDGYRPYRSGGYGRHTWVEINYSGSWYVCDPYFEYMEGRNGYMINYGQSGTWRYQIKRIVAQNY